MLIANKDTIISYRQKSHEKRKIRNNDAGALSSLISLLSSTVDFVHNRNLLLEQHIFNFYVLLKEELQRTILV